MSKVGILLQQLQSLHEQGQYQQMALYAQMLLAELQLSQTVVAHNKVSVVMPATNVMPHSEASTDNEGSFTHNLPQGAPTLEAQEVAPVTTADVTTNEYNLTVNEPTPANAIMQSILDVLPQEPTVAIPTLPSEPAKEVYELNDVMAEMDTESLNEKLKIEQIELTTVLSGTPVKDLKKAIGINDRFLFINELFRGDDVMYERSIKTINNFEIYPEAQFWIQRELKVKLGWDDSNEAVKQFDALVKRRFAS
ncbi:MAG TPA: hypothetical protein DCL43_04785 [Chitinophagaceae bacterium]|nr:hypothetical protein [Chitinophagaceae bacterium]HAN39806.1 hypothetical protein [Chitinophagaceae bacterium]